MEFELGQDEHGICNAGILHILLGSQNDVSGILIQRAVFGIVNDHRVAGDG